MTDLRQKLLDMAREAAGDPDIVVAGDFQPKGLTWKRAAGAGVGSLIGDELGGDVGQVLGAEAGYIGGNVAGTSGQLPPVVVLAASPRKLYVFMTNNGKGLILAKSLVLIDTLDRANLTVELKQRLTTRTAVIKDESTGHEYDVEGRRYLFHHMNALLDALHGDGADADADVHDDHVPTLAGV